MVHSLKDTVIGHLDIILAVHYIISQVVSSGCLSRGTFFAQMELMVWCGREVGWWWQCQGEQREGKGRVENGFQFWTHHIWVIILHVVEPCPPLPQTPLVQTRKKNQINKEKSPKKKKILRRRTETERSPNWPSAVQVKSVIWRSRRCSEDLWFLIKTWWRSGQRGSLIARGKRAL